jgi:hypothetical protein
MLINRGMRWFPLNPNRTAGGRVLPRPRFDAPGATAFQERMPMETETASRELSITDLLSESSFSEW